MLAFAFGYTPNPLSHRKTKAHQESAVDFELQFSFSGLVLMMMSCPGGEGFPLSLAAKIKSLHHLPMAVFIWVTSQVEMA